MFVGIAVFASPSWSQKLDYRVVNQACSFKYHCHDKARIRISPDGQIDFSQCDKVNWSLKWNPTAQSFVLNGKSRKLHSMTLKRRSVSINAIVEKSYVNFSAGRKLGPTLRFRNGPSGRNKIIGYYDGTCKAVK
jgi:hypothetical protein